MRTRQLGKTDLHITPLGFGSWALGGGGWAFSWGPQEDESSVATINRALDLGVNWIDTAAVYGLGHSEEVVARAVKGRSTCPYIFTKCSLVWDDRGVISNNLHAQSIRRELEATMRRLETDVIDLYQIHWPIPESDIEEGWSTLADLKAEGKVRYIGVTNFNVEQMQRIQRIAPIDSLQPRYSLIHREIEDEILPFCEKFKIGVIVYSPMASGLLTGMMTPDRIAKLPEDDWRKRDPDFQKPRLSRNLALVEILRNIGYLHGLTPGEVAIAWTLRQPTVTGAIVGARNPDQFSQIIGAAEFRLNEVELSEIEKFLQQQP